MIVVFGSLNVDLVFRVTALPRPGETTLAPSYTPVAGGKGANQALAARRAAPAGAVVMAVAVGDDEWAEVATAELRAGGVDISHLATAAAPTGCAAVMVDAAGENAVVVASGANRAADAATVPDNLLGPDTWLVLQMEVPADANWALVRRARRAGAQILLNVAPAASAPATVLDTVDVLVANAGEAAAVAAALSLHDDDPLALARALAGRHGLACVITLGSDGAVAATSEAAWEVAAPAVAVVDTTGAGDAFAGTLAATLASGAALPDALARANVAGALACTVAGAQPSLPTANAIDAALATAPRPTRCPD